MTAKVGITGIGWITPFGRDIDQVFGRLLIGESAVESITEFDTSDLPCHLGAEVKDFKPLDLISARNLRKMDKNSSMAASAAKLALADAGLEVGEDNRDRIGVVLGVAYGAVEVSVRLAETIFTGGPRQANPLIVPNVVMNAPAGHTSIELGLRGINTTFNHNGAAAETALAYAAAEVGRGRADAVICGGSDVMSRFFHEALCRFWALSGSRGGSEAARPFDRDANGFAPGEAAGVVVVERIDDALARGRRPYAELSGWGLTSTPASITDWPADSDGAVRCLEQALDMAGLAPGDVDAVWASANGNPKLDRMEADALARVFGQWGVKVAAVKGALGESFSSGGLRTALAALSLVRGQLPPAVGAARPIDGVDLVLAPQEGLDPRAALVTGLAAGGTNAAVVLKRYQD
jgi:3-oxoacyl-[acyl-carrier-protein] synthase II